MIKGRYDGGSGLESFDRIEHQAQSAMNLIELRRNFMIRGKTASALCWYWVVSNTVKLFAESKFSIRFRFWTLSLIGFDRGHLIWLVLYIKPVWPVTVEANQRHSKSEPDTNIEERFSTAEARGPSLRFGVFSFAVSQALSALGPLEPGYTYHKYIDCYLT